MPETREKIDEETVEVTHEAVKETFLKKNLLKQQAYLEKKLQETNDRLAVFD